MNRNYAYGNSSITHIETTEPIVQKLCHQAMQVANNRKLHCPDFGISRGFSTVEEQYKLYSKGRDSWGRVLYPWLIVTNCDGTFTKSPHQFKLAVDFFAYIDGKADYEPANLALIATCFYEAASDLGIEIEWGGNWKSIADAPHIEVKNQDLKTL